MKYFVLRAVAGMFNFVEGTIIVQCFPDALPFAETTYRGTNVKCFTQVIARRMFVSIFWIIRKMRSHDREWNNLFRYTDDIG